MKKPSSQKERFYGVLSRAIRKGDEANLKNLDFVQQAPLNLI